MVSSQPVPELVELGKRVRRGIASEGQRRRFYDLMENSPAEDVDVAWRCLDAQRRRSHRHGLTEDDVRSIVRDELLAIIEEARR